MKDCTCMVFDHDNVLYESFYTLYNSLRTWYRLVPIKLETQLVNEVKLILIS